MKAPHPKLARITGDVEGLLWPPLSTGLPATIASLLHRLERTQWLPAERIADLQRLQLRTLAAWFAARSPFVAERLAAAGVTPDDLAAPGGLERLPILTKQELQTGGAALRTDPPPGHQPVQETVTTGSTGTPLTVARTQVTGIFHAGLTVRDYLWRDVDFTGRLGVVRHGPKEPGDLSTWGMPIDLLFQCGPARVVPVGFPIDELAAVLARFRPETLIIYPTVLGGLVDHCRETGTPLDSLRHVQTVGETLDPAVRAGAAEVFGAVVWDLYSSQEVGVIASQCAEEGQYHVAAENVIVEVVDDDGRPVPEGGVGRVVVTDLHNLATPILRYDQGDVAEVGGPCPCGRGLPTLRRVLGRERHFLRMRDGRRRWPLFGSHNYRSVAPVVQQQIVQTSLDTLEARLRVERPLTEQEEAAVKAIMIDHLGEPFEIRFVYLDEEIPRGPGGKYEEFRCEVA